MPSGICMEIHTEIVQKRKKKQSRDEGIPRQPHVYLYDHPKGGRYWFTYTEQGCREQSIAEERILATMFFGT